MKKLLPLLILAITAVLFLGCPMDEDEAYTAQERMEAFIEDANNKSWGSLKKHTHPDAEQYNLGNASFWENHFSVSIPLASLNVSGSTATFSGKGFSYSATLEEDGEDNYKIRQIFRTNDSKDIFH